MTTIPEYNRTNNCDIFNFVRKTLDIVYRGYLWHGTIKNKAGNLRDNTFFKIAERKDNFNDEKFWRKKSVNYNHTN